MKKLIVIALMLCVAFIFSGCAPQIKNIPPGYKAKILTPTGWQKGYISQGQVDIGELNVNGVGNTLVLIESSSITVKEEFLSNTDGEDHRVLTQNKLPLAVDFYCQIALPDSDQELDMIFSMSTPKSTQDNRVLLIDVAEIYNRFAKQYVRGKTRAIFAQYPDYDSVVTNYEKLSGELTAAVIAAFKANNIPMRVVNAQLSNVKPDAKMWEATVQQAAADDKVNNIDKLGKAMRENPEYMELLKWESLERIADKMGSKGLIIITESGSSKISDQFAAVQYLKNTTDAK